MKITKCETCLKKYHELYGICPYFEIIGTSFVHINKAFSLANKKPATQHSIPKEFLDYDFKCKYYSPKPMTEEAFL